MPTGERAQLGIVEHVISGVQAELRREQDNVVVILSQTVRKTLQDEDRLGAGPPRTAALTSRMSWSESVWIQQKSLDRVIELSIGQIERSSDRPAAA